MQAPPLSSWAKQAMALGGTVGFTAVMTTIGLGLGRQWTLLDPQVYGDTFLRTFLLLLPCIALTLTPALVGVIASLRDAPKASAARQRWLLALGGLVASVLITLVYNLPANFRIWSGDLSPEELTSELHWWLVAHALRTLAGLVAAIGALQAIAASRTKPPN